MKNNIKPQNQLFSNGLSFVAIMCFLALASCQKESDTLNDQNNIFNDIKTEMRITNWCDGLPMPNPPIVVKHEIIDDTCCCFTLEFSSIYPTTWWQIIGVDDDRTWAEYYGCGLLSEVLDSNNQAKTCITTRATHITVTLLYPGSPGGGYCTMIELPCRNKE